MPVYQGELKDGRNRWLGTLCILADDENKAAKKLGMSSIAFGENFSVLHDDESVKEVCERSPCKIAEGHANFALTSKGKEGRVMWLPIDDYARYRASALEKAREVESWG